MRNHINHLLSAAGAVCSAGDVSYVADPLTNKANVPLIQGDRSSIISLPIGVYGYSYTAGSLNCSTQIRVYGKNVC